MRLRGNSPPVIRINAKLLRIAAEVDAVSRRRSALHARNDDPLIDEVITPATSTI